MSETEEKKGVIAARETGKFFLKQNCFIITNFYPLLVGSSVRDFCKKSNTQTVRTVQIK